MDTVNLGAVIICEWQTKRATMVTLITFIRFIISTLSDGKLIIQLMKLTY